MTTPNHVAYNVHIYREMRLFYPEIAAASPEAAAFIAAAKPADHAATIEDCDGETMSALVDVVADADYDKSRIIDFGLRLLLKSALRLRDALEAIAGDDDACTCHVRGWYGEGHDTQCPLRIAGDAVATATRKSNSSRALRPGSATNQ